MKEQYEVRVLAGKTEIDSALFPVGSFKEIGYWLDNLGYIAQDYVTEIRVIPDAS